MRKYNTITDYSILEKAVKDRLIELSGITPVQACGLSDFKKVLNENGIEFPSNFNSNFSEESLALDKDICKVWGV